MTNQIETAWITLTQGCDLGCSYCYASGAISCPPMGYELVEKLLGLSYGMGVTSIIYTGGEPTSYDRLNDAITLAKEMGFECGFPTSGLFYADPSASLLLSETHVDSISLSIKGWDEHSYLDKTGVDGYRLALRAASNLVSAGVPVVASMVVEHKGLQEMPRVISDLNKAGVEAFSFTPVFDTLSSNSGSKPEAVVGIVNDFNEMYEHLDSATGGNFVFEQNVPLCLWDLELVEVMVEKSQLRSVCQLLKGDGIVFGCDGELLLCNALHNFPLGKYGADFESSCQLAEYLDSAELIAAKARMTSPPSKECSLCSLYSVCAGGCAMRWIRRSFDEFKPYMKWDPRNDTRAKKLAGRLGL